MRDIARKYTDRELHKLTKELERVYSRALSETKDTWNRFAAKHEAKANELWKAVKAAEATGDKAAIAETKSAYRSFLQKTTFGNARYKQTVDEISTRLAHIDQQTWRTVNRLLPDIYAKNYNSLKLPEHYVLKIVDPNTVTNLALKDIQLLKDTRWNIKRLNAEILQGIMQGESMDKIGMRLRPFVGGNKAAALRNARTAVTSAENAGKLDSMADAEGKYGIVYKKRWVATHDNRTRDSHAAIDGEEVFLDESFSNGCDYPADPKGEPEETFNCRCTMNRVLWGIYQADGSFKRIYE